MKTIKIMTLILLNLFLLFGCFSTEENPIEIDYESILDTFWENYLIEATYQNIESSDMIEEINILGYYYYVKDLGDDATRSYIGDEGILYNLHAIIKFKEGSNLKPQYYNYQWISRTLYGQQSLQERINLEIIDDGIDLTEYMSVLKSDSHNFIEKFKSELIDDMTEESKLETKIYNDTYMYEQINPYLSNVNNIIERDNIIYLVKEDKAIVARYKESEEFNEVVILSEIDGIPVTEIYPKAFMNIKIDGLIIPSTIEVIGEESFTYATCIGIIFEDNSQLKVIGRRAFYGAVFLEITIPISVEEIGESAFEVTRINRIRVEAIEKPDGWSDYWVGDDQVVIWGYKTE
ncbi:MAG: hypothetical protein A2Y45_08780 [Tenericutes bacterium GWC2_34_14]|nr:MAG: hypothetical protein A2Z84_04650 [Tenericutes bacterium GWA2_35_7]OHE29987.1 MAG: hypothetical protein A2Y45_08780 [Tenericutes bacterium GWC2_34_14]OHE34966.1 MAG: hypothetical protein A2012_02390 [Tenericutes bacterium GWE2_34_108]OHE37174.1 MAG: hypothetical protein A2Y46_00620 [Tenericutes bacterium GWF1_35_14]OHE39694.1 MAG: hypothetical protein A2Y44_02240 [Tenericutes bacterium GWF2_35_184]OHE44118.1 MAG: hypothetical protein A2221_03270 [Tenericutes bacterium RIFOXYA2_FULL_36_3